MESSTGLRGIPFSSLLGVLLFSPIDEHTQDISSYSEVLSFATITNVGVSSQQLDV